jgi:hypothetical protein
MTPPEQRGPWLARTLASRIRRAQPAAPAAAPAPPAAPVATPAPDPTVQAGRLLVLVGVRREDVVDAVPEVSDPEWTIKKAGSLKPPGARETWAEVSIVAGSLAELRRIAPWLLRAGRSERVAVTVLATDRPTDLRVPTAPVQPGTEVVEAHVDRAPGPAADLTTVTVAVRASRPAPVLAVVRAVLTIPVPAGGSAPAAGLRLGLTSGDALAWACGDPCARLIGPWAVAQGEVDGLALDLLVGPEIREEPDETDLPRIQVFERLLLPPVDTAVVSPIGFSAVAGSSVATLTVQAKEGSASTFRVLDPDGAELAAGDLRAGFTENHVRALRPLRMVELEPDPAPDGFAVGRLLSQLACAGVPVRAPGLPPELAEVLGTELAHRLGSLDHATAADPAARESWSLGTRRLALSRFAPEAYWSAHGRAHGRPVTGGHPEVSVLLTTRRAQMVPFALAQVDRQDWPALETVLVLHDVSKDDPTVRRAIDGFAGRLEVVEVGPGVVFGQALNAGVARSSGRLLAKMDDDDWYSPHHITDLVLARSYSGAAMTGAASYFAYLHSSNVTVRWAGRTESTTSWVAGGTLLFAADDLARLGGWRAVPRSVDFHLIRALRDAGGSLFSINGLGYVLYRGHDHTWFPGRGDDHWLDRDTEQFPGFSPPGEIHPLAHPSLGEPATPREPQPNG